MLKKKAEKKRNSDFSLIPAADGTICSSLSNLHLHSVLNFRKPSVDLTEV